MTAGNLMLTVMESFEMKRKDLKKKSKDTTPNTLKMLKTTTVEKCSDAIKVHLSQVFGPRSCDLSYLIRSIAAVPAVAHSLEMNQPHSSEPESIQE